MIGQWQKGRWQNNVWLRRGLFVLFNAAVLSGLLCLFAWPIQAFFADRDAQISQQRAVLAGLNAIAAQRTTVAGLAVQSASDGSVEFLLGGNDGVAAANLQTLVKGMVEPTGARLRSIRTLPTKPQEDMKFIGVQVDITGTIQAVYQSVRAVEAAKPFLFIVGALLKPTQQAMMAPSGISTAPTIDAQLDIVGAMQIEGDK
jgi:Type II secretion system (T2SS), protein M subtype b